LVIVPLAGLAGARFLVWDATPVLVAANAVTPFVYVPAWPVVVLAAVLRRWGLLGTAGLVVVAHLVFVLPEVLAATAVPHNARRAPRLRLFTANVLSGNRDVRGYAEEIRHTRPDVVVLQEASPPFLAALRETGALSELVDTVVIPRLDPFAMVVASRWPLSEEEILPAQGRPVVLRATVTLPGREARLLAVHAMAPTSGHLKEWEDDLELVRRSIVGDRRCLLVVGDFNATWGNRPFHRLLDRGLTDGAAARSAPFAMTWPRNRRFVPPVVRIDHVLTGNGAVVTNIRSGSGEGSDHRPLIADIALTGTATGTVDR